MPVGEVEAAEAVGLSRFQRFQAVIAPHALRIALRSHGNEVVFLIKGTSAASLVTIVDLMGAAHAVYFNTYHPFTPLLLAGAVYLVLVLGLTRLVTAAECWLWPELRNGGGRETGRGSRRDHSAGLA